MTDTAEQMTPAAEAERREPLPLLTWFACLLCIALTIGFQVSLRYGTAFRFGYQPVTAIWGGRYDALFTAVFLHGTPLSFATPLSALTTLTTTLLHIGFNLLWLAGLGSLMERTLRPWQWTLFFVCAAVVSSGAEIALVSTEAIGASGLVYAMFGLMWTGRHRYPTWRMVATRGNMIVFVGWGLFCVVATALGWMRVANAAHAGGFLFGLAVGELAFHRRRPYLASGTLAVLVLLTIASVTWLPWSPVWTQWKGDTAAQHGRTDEAIRWYRASMRRGADRETLWSQIYSLETARHNDAGARAALYELLRRK